MFLSRLRLDTRNYEVRRDLRNIQDLHRTIMAAFPNIPETAARSAMGVLFRLEAPPQRDPEILVQSELMPDWGKLPAGYLREPPVVRDLAPLLAVCQCGSRMRFRLDANPIRQIARFDGEGKIRNSAKVPLRDPEARQAWFARKLEQAGCRVIEVQISVPPLSKPVGHVKGESDRTFEGVRFEGLLEVLDVSLFEKMLRTGIGPGKSYGLGLLSVAPAANTPSQQ